MGERKSIPGSPLTVEGRDGEVAEGDGEELTALCKSARAFSNPRSLVSETSKNFLALQSCGSPPCCAMNVRKLATAGIINLIHVGKKFSSRNYNLCGKEILLDSEKKLDRYEGKKIKIKIKIKGC
jgi:hypothetical protein